jgi:hypothetical protein
MPLLKKLWPAALILVVIFLFLSGLFFPKQSLIITPDYGRSDSWSLSIANKYYYSQQLKKNKLPIWNSHIGMGFPTLAEGQTGILFPLNLILFRLIPFTLAYNLSLALSLITTALGTYLFCRSLKLSKFSSIFAGLIFSMGGFFTFHLQHHSLIETASLLPWVFWATNEFIKTKKLTHLLAISLISGLQLLAGFPQLTFYTQFSLLTYVILRSILKKPFKIKPLIAVSVALLFGFFLAAIQIIPTYELFKESTRTTNPAEILSQFPYTYKNLLQFLDPFILGSPKTGTYPIWQPGKWGIFWESSAYIGIIPLALAIGIAVGNIFKKKKSKLVLHFSILALIVTLLALGNQSPLYVIFSIPPFSLFRVPSRFLLLSQFCLVILAAIYLDKLRNKHVTWILVAFSVLNIFILLKNYNPTLEAKKLLENPKTVQFLNKNTSANVYTIGSVHKWNENFLKNGWGNINNFYFFENYLDQNSNLIFGINQFAAYESLQTKRVGFLKSIINKQITSTNGAFHFQEKATQLLLANNVSHIISPYEVESGNIEKTLSVTQNENSVNAYRILGESNILSFSNNFVSAETVSDITAAVSSNNFDPENTPVIEGRVENKLSKSKMATFEMISREENFLSAKTQTDGSYILTFRQSFYPGWHAFIDSKEVYIYPANVNSMAVIVPKGNHEILFKYQPVSIIYGAIISIVSLTVILYLFFKFRKINIT